MWCRLWEYLILSQIWLSKLNILHHLHHVPLLNLCHFFIANFQNLNSKNGKNIPALARTCIEKTKALEQGSAGKPLLLLPALGVLKGRFLLLGLNKYMSFGGGSALHQ